MLPADRRCRGQSIIRDSLDQVADSFADYQVLNLALPFTNLNSIPELTRSFKNPASCVVWFNVSQRCGSEPAVDPETPNAPSLPGRPFARRNGGALPSRLA
jgi:hypothetical protein